MIVVGFIMMSGIWMPFVPAAEVQYVHASLTEAQPVQGFQLNFRFSLEIMNRSLALKITNIEEGDLGLYYCIANVETALTVGRGTTLQVSSQGSSWSFFQHCMVVGFVLLVMVLAVCITHWKANFNRENTN
ncbi:hypothetical protein CesoFtcFv8_009399 [Champsocephalus esox]|uniref:Immunoglobulin V-set domain-containing protein n=1 Tax=Champsocephalus esox TaxID=159716 RepID=A0AAN8C9U5_9TELE|nr:hypothetical protein CesoFtcFv8_009399 [Champsocephalus esox]